MNASLKILLQADCHWYIKIPSVKDFISRCLHQHYAIGPQNGRLNLLEILTGKQLRLADL